MVLVVVMMIRYDAQEDDNDAVNHLYDDDDGFGNDCDGSGEEDPIWCIGVHECMKYSGSGAEHFKLRSRGTPETLGDHYRGDYEFH